jgi:hypothetical protein
MPTPLPPRPDKEVQIKNSEQYLSEKTLQEQAAGKTSIEQSKLRLEQEQEAGRKAVEENTRRMTRKA